LSLKKGEIDLGFIEKVGSTAMQSEQEKPKSNSRLGFGLNKARSTDSASIDKKDTTSTNEQPGADSKQDMTQPERHTSSTPHKGEAGYEEPHEEEEGAVPSSNLAQNDEGQGEDATDDQAGHFQYPEQRHAGKVDGVGPEFGAANRVTVSDRLQGWKDQIKGTVTRKPDVKQRGLERRTGELKEKEKEEADKSDPFANAPDDKTDDKPDEAKDSTESERDRDESSNNTPLNDPKDTNDTNEQQDAEAGLSEVPHSHPTEKGKVEQAANVDPEGSSPRDSKVEEKAHENATSGQVNGRSQ